MAKLFSFDDEFKLGIEAADIEHGRLVEMLNQTHELLLAGKREEARAYFNRNLSDYVHTHFQHEEKFLESIGYPDLENHRKVHENFRKSFEERKPLIAEADDAAFRSALSDVFVWIINHIGKTDRKYAKFYFEKKGQE